MNKGKIEQSTSPRVLTTGMFIDNILRFSHAGSEVSALPGRTPSAVGYQPTLAAEMGDLQERIMKGGIEQMQQA